MSISSESLDDICALCKSPQEEPDFLCSNCLSQICSSCTVLSHEHPLCTVCSSHLTHLISFIESENLSWYTQSLRGSQWLSLSGAKAWSDNQHLSINSYLEVLPNQSDTEMIEKDVETGRSDPNTFMWEIKETLLRIFKPSYKSDIKSVLRAYCVRNSKVGYCQGMNYVTVWLLMFMDQNSAFVMLCYLIEKWLMPEFYIGNSGGNSLNGFYIESTVIASIIEHLIPAMQENPIPTSEFSDFFSLQHLIQIFVGTVDMQTTVFLWDKLAEHGSIALIRGVVCLVVISEHDIKNGIHPVQVLKKLSEKRVVIQVRKIYSDLLNHVTLTRVEKLRKMARAMRAKQWMECEKIVVRKLEKVCKFDAEEIERLQKGFVVLMRDMEGKVGKRKMESGRLSIYLPVDLQEKMEDFRGSHTIGIQKPEFVKLLQEIAPALAEYGEELFDTFDEDRSGYLDFRELTIAMSFISKGSFEDKLRLCFDAYDTEKQGFLKDVEIQILIERILTPYIRVIAENPGSQNLQSKIIHVHQKMTQLSAQSKGKISFNNFLNSIKADLFLYNCVSDYLGFTHRPQVTKLYSALHFQTFNEEPEARSCKLCKIT